MGRTRRPAVITAERAARLYKLLLQIRSTPKPRSLLLRKLCIKDRGFYRDLEYLRRLGVQVDNQGELYRLLDPLDEALARLPFPDPRLSLRDALQLAQGRSRAHRLLRTRVVEVVGTRIAFSKLLQR